HVRELLAPGGMLVLLEVTAPQRWLDVIFGLTEGWWKFTDVELRSKHPLLSNQKWQALLKASGFDEAAGISHERSAGGQSIVLARASAEVATSSEPWLVFADRNGVGDVLAAELRERGEKCVVVYRGEENASGLLG